MNLDVATTGKNLRLGAGTDDMRFEVEEIRGAKHQVIESGIAGVYCASLSRGRGGSIRAVCERGRKKEEKRKKRRRKRGKRRRKAGRKGKETHME